MLVLCGDVTATFGVATAPFVTAASRCSIGDGRIALLMQGGPAWEQFVDRYRRPWREHGAAEVVAVVPDEAGVVGGDALAVIDAAGGIFIGGGDPKIYQKAFATSPVAEVIRTRVNAGVPFGGVSAGAMLAAQTSVIGGTTAHDDRSSFRLTAALDEDDGALELAPGLGLINDVIIEPHFAELGGFPRLVEGLRISGMRFGLGIDEPIALEIAGERIAVSGAGRLYLVERKRTGDVCVSVHRPGDTLSLRRS